MNRSHQLAAFAFSALSVSPVAQSSWKILPTPNPSPSSNQLYALDASAPDDVWAVGVHASAATGFLSLALHWDGADWRQEPTPTPSTGYWWKSVSAIGRKDVWVVGGHGIPYAFHFDGEEWTTMVLPPPGQFSFGIAVEDVVACSSGDVWAVGHYDQTGTAQLRTAIWHWNGSSWTVVPSPSVPNTTGGFYPSVLLSISAVSPNSMFAVGEWRIGNRWFPLALHWNGTNWRIVPTPLSPSGDGRLRSVSARTADDVWAVGTANDTAGVIGGGYGRALAMHFDGKAWSVIPTPQPSPWGANPLRTVIARGAEVYAIGSSENATQGLDTLILELDRRTGEFMIATSANVPGNGQGWNELQDATRVGAETWAVGWGSSAFNSSRLTLVERTRNWFELRQGVTSAHPLQEDQH